MILPRDKGKWITRRSLFFIVSFSFHQMGIDKSPMADDVPMGIWILSTRMMPPIVIAAPLFWIMKRIHLVGTDVGLILIYVMIQLPFVIWMMKGFFDEVPQEMGESVFIDGGTRATCIFRVVLPVAFPGIVATALFCIFLTWTEFLFASNSFITFLVVSGSAPNHIGSRS